MSGLVRSSQLGDPGVTAVVSMAARLLGRARRRGVAGRDGDIPLYRYQPGIRPPAVAPGRYGA
ncbi:hypothetical protein GCM10010505_11160 [Kitasatospora aburaviensis]